MTSEPSRLRKATVAPEAKFVAVLVEDALEISVLAAVSAALSRLAFCDVLNEEQATRKRQGIKTFIFIV